MSNEILEYRDYQIAAGEAAIRTLEGLDRLVHPLITVPTGGGKSLTINYVAQRLPGNILVVTHRIRLLRQNAARIDGTGILSGQIGEDRFDSHRILTGTYQTLLKREFGTPDFIILDECHLLNVEEETRLGDLLQRFPQAPVIGLTATPFRGNSPIYHGARARWRKVYEIDLKTLIKRGFLVPPRTLRTEAAIGDEATLLETTKAVIPVCMQALEKHQRRHVVIFCQDIDHTRAVTQMLTNAGAQARAVHSLQSDDENQANYDWFEEQNEATRFIVNCNMLTIGVDLPAIDAIVLLRRISFMGTYVQILGRGLRAYPGKNDCAVFDYGGSVKRFGFLDDLRSEQSRQGAGRGVTMKQCQICETWTSLRTQTCSICGNVFSFRSSISGESTDLPALSGNLRIERISDITVKRNDNGVWELCYHLADRPEAVREYVSTKITADKRESERKGRRAVIESNQGISEIVSIID
jgi:DNA repair protein RadD